MSDTGFDLTPPTEDQLRQLSTSLTDEEKHVLLEHGTDAHCIVVMDTDPERLAVAEEMGCNVIEADATRDENQMAVRIDRARTVLRWQPAVTLAGGIARFAEQARASEAAR